MAISPSHGNIAVPAQPALRNAGPVAIGRFVAPIAGKTLSRGGPVMAGLLAQWAAISGPTLAAYTMPAKLTRAAPEPDFPEKFVPSVLHLKVDPAKALEVQYAIPQLVERINQALGYKAVAGIRVLQAPVGTRQRAAAPKTSIPAPAADAGNGGRLASALARMAAGVKARPGSSQ
ncbi:MAG: DciA family protein [Rhodomicrobium sp.]